MPESRESSDQPNLLPGASSTRLIVRGYTIMIGSGCFVFPLTLESKFKSFEGYYIAFFLSLSLGTIILGLGVILWGYRKGKLEIERGYTPDIKGAEEKPELFLVNFKTLEVVARPHERRR